MSKCYECGQEWELNAPSHGHHEECEQGADEGRWLASGLSQFEKDWDFVIVILPNGQPRCVPKEDLEEVLKEIHGDS